MLNIITEKSPLVKDATGENDAKNVKSFIPAISAPEKGAQISTNLQDYLGKAAFCAIERCVAGHPMKFGEIFCKRGVDKGRHMRYTNPCLTGMPVVDMAA